jgi:hypothetical protein
LRCDRKAERESKTNKRIERRKRMNGISYQINEDGVELITTWIERPATFRHNLQFFPAA